MEQPVQETSRRSPRGLAPERSSREVSPQAAVKRPEHQGVNNRVQGNIHHQLRKLTGDDISKKIADFISHKISL